MSEKKPLEYWIEFYGDPKQDAECYKRYVSGRPMEVKVPGYDVIHVIEKNAYDALKAENSRLRKGLYAVQHTLCWEEECYCDTEMRKAHQKRDEVCGPCFVREALNPDTSKNQPNLVTSQGYDQKSGKSKHEEQE